MRDVRTDRWLVMTKQLWLIETVGGTSNNAGEVIRHDPVELRTVVDRIAHRITHPEEDYAVAVEIVQDIYNVWATEVGGWDRGDTFRVEKKTRQGVRVFTLWGSELLSETDVFSAVQS